MGSVVSFWKSTIRCIHSISAVVDEVSLARASRSARRSALGQLGPLGGGDRRALPAGRRPSPALAPPLVGGPAVLPAPSHRRTWPSRRPWPLAVRCRPIRSGRRARVLLVPPVGGDPVLGPPVHLVGADLDLDGLAVEADHRGVQRLVEVELGRVDVVLEPALDRGPDGVDRAQRGPAVLLRLDDDPDPDQVVEVVELLAPHHHLLVDAPQVLRPPGHLGGRPRRRPAAPAPTPAPGPGTRRAGGPGWPPSARSPRSACGGGWRRPGPRAAT